MVDLVVLVLLEVVALLRLVLVPQHPALLKLDAVTICLYDLLGIVADRLRGLGSLRGCLHLVCGLLLLLLLLQVGLR